MHMLDKISLFFFIPPLLLPTTGGLMWDIIEKTWINLHSNESDEPADPVGLLAAFLYILRRVSYWKKI